MLQKTAIVSYSGGMDSTVLLYHAKRYHDKVIALSFNYKQRHSKELVIANYNTDRLGIEHKIIDISFFKDLANTSSLTNNNIDVDNVKDMMGDAQPRQYIPFRNMMLLSICCAAAESNNANTVYHGAAEADSVAGYWDGAQSFIEAMNNVSILNRKNKIEIVAPLLPMSKSKIIQYGKDLSVDFSKTWTCYSGRELSCGTCPACSLRLQGFIEAKLRDPLTYEIQDKLEAIYKQKECVSL
jgi:7-cyano-7-deazaguanine synthase